jgi:hypothetical protein
LHHVVPYKSPHERAEHVQNCVVVFDRPIALPDGTAVKVEAIEAPANSAKRSLLDRLGDFIGKAEGLPADVSQNVDRYLYGLLRCPPAGRLPIRRHFDVAPPCLVKSGLAQLISQILIAESVTTESQVIICLASALLYAKAEGQIPRTTSAASG